MPRLLREIILTALSPHEDLEVIEMEQTGIELETAEGAPVEVLMLGCDDAQLTERQERLLLSCPQTRIVAIDGKGRQAALYELRVHREPLPDLSPDRLVSAIRAVASS